MGAQSFTIRTTREHRREDHPWETRILFNIVFAACLVRTLVARVMPKRRDLEAGVKPSIIEESRAAASTALVGYTLLR